VQKPLVAPAWYWYYRHCLDGKNLMMVENCRLRRERFDEFCQKPTIVYHVTPIDNQVE
jgi:hypothetical protein